MPQYLGKLYVQDLIDSGFKYLYTRYESPEDHESHVDAMMKSLTQAARPLVKIEELPDRKTIAHITGDLIPGE